MRVWRVGIINDLHIPWHDPVCVTLALQIIKDSNCDEIVLNGDVLDMYTCNSHGPKNPDIQETFESEIAQGRDFFKMLRETFPDKKITFIFGNHEDRIERFIMKECPAFWNMVKLESMLNLEQLRINFLKYPEKYMLNRLLGVQHSPPSYGVNGARTSLMAKPGVSMVYACSHREQHSTINDAHGRTHYCYFGGWLGNSKDYIQNKIAYKWMKGHENWQNCMHIADIFDDENFTVHPISFNNGYASWGNKHYHFEREQNEAKEN